jgi:hypothetical protein
MTIKDFMIDSPNNRNEAQHFIAERVFLAQELLRECKKVAEEHDLTFAFDVSDDMIRSEENSSWYSSNSSC